MDANETGTPARSTEAALRQEVEELRARNRELAETIEAIRLGEVDAIVVSEGGRQQVYALEGADHPYRVLVENIREGALILTTGGTILFANAAFAAMRGLPLSAVLGTPLRDHVAPRDRAAFDGLLERSRTGACPGELSLSSGTLSLPVQVSMTPLAMNGDTKISVVLTDRREDYDRLRLQARMLDSVADAVTAVDPGGTVVYWNESAARLYGWRPSEAVGGPMIATVDPVMPAGDAGRAVEPPLPGETWSGEALARHRDGRRFPVLATRAPVYDEDGTLVAVISTSHDIRDRKEAEEELRQSREWFRVMGETLPYGVWRCNAHGGAEYVSQSFLDLLEMTQEEMREFGWTHRLPPDEVEPMLERWFHCIETGEDWDDEHHVLGPDGVYHTVLTRGRPVRDRNGAIVAWVGINLDIDDRKEAERVLAESEERQAFLLALSDALRPLTDPVEIQATTSRILGERLGVDHVFYATVEAEEGAEYLVIGRDYHAPGTPSHAGRYPAAAFSAAASARGHAGETTAVPDIETDPEMGEAEREAYRALGARARIGVPLIKGGRLVAALGIDQATARAWTPAEVALAEATAERTWSAVGRARAERALAESEEKYRSLVDLSPDAVVVYRRGAVLYANPAAARLLRAEPGAFVGTSILDFVYPDDRAAAVGRIAAVQERGETAPLREFRLLIDGAVIDAEAVGGPVHWDGAPAVQVIIREISERKRAEEALRESEERYRALIAASSQVLYRMSPDWSEMRELRGGGFLADTERPNPDWVQGYIHPDDRPRVLAAIADAVRAGTVFDLEHRVLRADGTPGWTQSRAVPVRDAAGRVVEWFGAASDITDRKEAEAERTRYADKLARSNEELQRFAYVASHDLQEPLRTIVSFSQLLARRYRGKLDRDADEFIAFIVEGGMRMQRLIQDLLQVSRVETAAKPLEPTDTGAVVAAALRLLETPIREAGATVEVGPLPRVLADAAQLEQVFANLVGNAIKYRRPEAPPSISISARCVDGMVEFSVQDNGIGIEAEYYDRIFEMFRRLHTHDEVEGTGIGLAVVKRIVERHGGSIRVESVPGEGSTFVFTLPAA